MAIGNIGVTMWEGSRIFKIFQNCKISERMWKD